MPALRDAGSPLACTENRTDPSPCPSAGSTIVTHPASGFALHWQSRFVVIRSEPEPPAAGNDGLSAVACNVHLFDDGAVRVSVWEEEPQAAVNINAKRSVGAVTPRKAPRRPVATIFSASERGPRRRHFYLSKPYAEELGQQFSPIRATCRRHESTRTIVGS